MQLLQASNAVEQQAGPSTRAEKVDTSGSIVQGGSGPDLADEETSRNVPAYWPFKGFLVCATGISKEEKAWLFELAYELGAHSSAHLTDRVTHLIAEEAGSQKYQCALQIGIPIMRLSWIIESYRTWLRGDDVDVAQSIEDHRFQPFLKETPGMNFGANKRRRTANVKEPWQDAVKGRNVNLPVSALRKDGDVWLSDGSIVVVAADNVAFRIHRGTLVRKSEVFRDLFESLPNAEAATAGTMEGCPIVRVSDLSEDIRPLFSVLCCGKNYYFDGDAPLPVPFKILASLIRMAHKYVMQDILNHALSRLKRYYTTDFATWMDPESRARYVTTTLEDAPTVVSLARLTNTPSLLPTAFLRCIELLTSFRELGGGAYGYKIAALPVPDQAMLIAANRYLITKCAERCLCLLAAVPCARCTTPEACIAAREAPLVALRDDDASLHRLFYATPAAASEAPLIALPSSDASLDPDRFYDRDVFEPIAMTFWGDAGWCAFCGHCRSSLVEVDEREMRWLWSGLPEVFGLLLTENDWPSSREDAGRETMSFVPLDYTP